MQRIQAIVAAGGEGRRFGGGRPKQLRLLAGRPVLVWSVEALRPFAERVVVAVPRKCLEEASALFAGDAAIRCVVGGESRWDSVRRALEALEASEELAEGDLVAVHDAARPAVSRHDLEALFRAARASGAAVLGRPVGDTIKRVEACSIVATLDRGSLFRAETPQVFERRLLDRGAALAAERGLDPTDESTLIESLDGVEVVAVAATRPNPKLTHPDDLPRLEALLRERPAEAPA